MCEYEVWWRKCCFVKYCNDDNNVWLCNAVENGNIIIINLMGSVHNNDDDIDR